MSTAAENAGTTQSALEQLASTIRLRHRSHLRELTLVSTDDGIVLHGLALSFYGKQVAFHEAVNTGNLRVIGNQIRVQNRSAAAN